MTKKRLISFNDDVSQAIDKHIQANARYYTRGRVSDIVNQAIIDYFNARGGELRIRGFSYVGEDGETYHHTSKSIGIG